MNKKYWWWLGIGIVVLAAVSFVYHPIARLTIDPRQSFKKFLESAPRSKSDVEIYDEKLLAAYRGDTYGNTTPEGTLELFTSALKAGDTELAAKYFLVDKQGQMTKDLKAAITSGAVKTLLNFIKNGSGSYYKNSTDRYELGVENNKGVVDFTINLVLNPYTKVWKIESL